MVQPQTQTKEVLRKVIEVDFLIQDVNVQVREGPGDYYEYRKIYVNIRDPKTNQEIRYQELSPDNINIRTILKNIDRLYDIYTRYSGNDKLSQALKEEMLKQISLLIVKLG